MELRYLLKGILLPPFTQIILLIFAWRLRNLRPRLAKVLYFLAILSLWILGTPIAATHLAFTLRQNLPIQPNYLSTVNADAIVILSGTQNETATEFGEPVSGEDTLIRIRYGAFLQRRTGLPVLLSGGSVLNDKHRSLAETMAFDLLEGFGLQTQWLETKSRTTAENAKFSYTILRAENKTSILLVTSSLHMMRAKWSFEQAGFNVIPAPTGFIDIKPLAVGSFLPNAHSLQLSRNVLHEWLGYLVYRILN